MSVLLAVHAVTGLAAIAFGARLGRRALLLAVVGPALTLIWLAARAPEVIDGTVVTERIEWVPELGIDLTLRLDGFALLLALLVSGIGVVVCAYSARYFAPRGEGLGRLIGLLALFAGSMLGVVLSDNLIALFAFWELTSLTSYLLIGNEHSQPRARAAALQALLVTGAGGLVMLAGFVLVGQAAGTFELSAILAEPPPSSAALTVGLVLVLVGAMTKSAQYPFHSWLAGAMIAPTPVSAYLHSATMVKAGIYVVARFAPVFATVAPWRATVVVVGLVSMIVGALRAWRQYDLKLLLAYSTISQLGFLFVLFGIGTTDGAFAGCLLIVAHALYKAALFMVVGIVDHESGTRDFRRLDGFPASWNTVRIVTIAAAASMAGIPLTLGFLAKEAAYDAFAHGQIAAAALVLVGLVVGSCLTVAYTVRFVVGVFFSPARETHRVAAVRVTHGASAAFLVAPALLAALGVLFGVVPALIDPLVDAGVRALVSGSSPRAVQIWHGITLALVLSVLTYVVGGLLAWARESLSYLLSRGAQIPSGEVGYLGSLRALNFLSDRVTGTVQSGSLPVYAGVILFTVALLPGIAILRADAWPSSLAIASQPAQIAIAALVVGAAVAAAAARRRFTAAISVGVTGYAMAGLFVVHGAPDLALTQVTVETLTVIVFMLVLRRLPDQFGTRDTPIRRVQRLSIALAVGVMVFVFAIVAGSSRTVAPVSAEMVARSLADAHGRNVVNVILVDFRAMDTLGEITVLTVAAIGAVALARAIRRPASRAEAPELTAPPSDPTEQETTV
jgi:multicomponent Na+:H+ antiporter subunit A